MARTIKNNQWLIFIAAVIVLSIMIAILFSGNLRPTTYVGEISGQKISVQQFQKAMASAKIQALLHYGKMFEQLESLFDLEQEAWDQLLLLSEAKKRGIKVSNQRVIEEIAKNDIFYRNKKFDPLLYKGIIKNSFKCEVKDFEETIRQSLIISKLFDAVTKNIGLSQGELLKEYKKANEKLQINYILFPAPKDTSSITVTDEEITDYYIKHNQELRLPLSINIGYVKLPFPPDGGVQKEVETKYKAIALKDQYAISKDLKSLAEKSGFTYSESGFFSKQQPNLDIGWTFETMLQSFKMKQGAMHEPVELKDGYLVFIVKEIKKAHLAELAEVKLSIKDKLIHQKAMEKAKNDAAQYQDKIKQLLDNNENQKAFDAIKKELGLEIKQSELLTKDKLLTDLMIDASEEYNFYALNTEKEISILQTESAVCLLYVQRFEPVKLEEIEKNKQSFQEELLKKKQMAEFNKFVEELTEETAVKKYEK